MFVWRSLPGRADARPGAFLALPALERRGIRAAFTNRTGGVSHGAFASLNLSYFSGDAPEAVRENRARILAALGAPPESWTGGRQVHDIRVVHAGAEERGRGAFDAESTLPGVDGIWTDEPGVALAVLAADCVPVLLADTNRRRIAVLHAGWRGLMGGIIERGVAAIRDGAADAPPPAAFVGPSIGPCCYEVGEEVAEAAREAFGGDVVVGRAHFDLWAAARRALARAGVRDVWLAALCTRSESHRFFSHRAGATGRQGLVAVLT